MHGAQCFTSRSASLAGRCVRVDIPGINQNNEIPDHINNDFQICLDHYHARDLLQFVFNNSPSEFLPKLWLQTVHVEPSLPSHRQCLNIFRRTTPGLECVDMCVVVDLCRPYRYSINMVSIYNGNTRSHSNVPDGTDHGISFLSARTDLAPSWCPHCPSDQTPDGPDFVVIRNTTQPQRGWCLEGPVGSCCGPRQRRAR